MELDVSAPAVSRRAWSIRAQIVPSAFIGRAVPDDCAGRIRQPDVELVVNTWFARVSGANGKIDVTELVCFGSVTDFLGSDVLARFMVCIVATMIEILLFRDIGLVTV